VKKKQTTKSLYLLNALVNQLFKRRRKMKTKKTAVVFMCACMAFACITGCKIQQHVTTLQGTLFNAITGERIGGKDVKMYLEQGTLLRKPDVFYTGVKTLRSRDNSTIDLMGDYAFANIPSMDSSATTTDPHANEYRLTVIKDGYQKFEGIVDKAMLADMDNVIRNIYLFPEEYLIPCYNYTATFNGKPVPGVTIVAAPYATINPGIIATDKWLSIGLGDALGSPISDILSVFSLFNNNYFFPAPGYLASIIEKTDADGQVSFCDNIAAGGAYLVCTTPVNFEGVDLMPQCFPLVAGYGDTDQVFELDLFPGEDYGNKYGLYVTSISNSVDDQIDATGTLTIKFNRAVTLGVRPDPIAPATAGFGVTFAFASAAVFPAAPASTVNAVLTDGGKTLTLTPTWTTAPAATELGQAITYTDNNGFLSVDGYPDSTILLTSLRNAKGNLISETVQLSTP
jgi:hypothetical protein